MPTASAKVSRHTSATLTIDTGQDEVTIDIDSSYIAPDEYTDIHFGPRSDGGYRLAWTVLDQDSGHLDPREDDYQPEWREVTPDRDYIWSYELRYNAMRMARDAIREVGRDRVAMVRCDDYQEVRYSLTSEFERAGYILIVPEDVLVDQRVAYLTVCVEEVQRWANGEVYGVIVREVDSAGQTIDPMEDCWGFIGHDYAETEAERSVA